MAEKEKGEKHKETIYYVKLASVNDLCRLACKFDMTSDMLLLDERKGANRLIAFGEKIGDTQIAYYAEVSGVGGIMRYTPPSGGTPESSAFTRSVEQEGRFYLPIMRLDMGAIATSDKVDDKMLSMVKAGGAIDVMRGIIRRSAKDEEMGHVYAFKSGSKHIVCAFNLVEELTNDMSTLYYAEEEGELGSFAKYNYKEDRLTFGDEMEGLGSFYIKVVNLAAPFPFFKEKA